MRERVYRTEALILRRSDFGEADRLITLATPAGRRRVIAKGIRKTTSKLAGHLELFTHASLLIAVGRNLDVITQSQTIEAHPRLRAELERLSCAYYLAELYDRFTEEEEENRPLFDLLVHSFAALDVSNNPDLIVRAFELRLLHVAGYRPHLHHCAACNDRLTEEADRFSPSMGGVLCPEHRSLDRHALPMNGPSFRLLRFIQSRPLAELETLNPSVGVRHEAEHLLRAFVRQLLERELKSVAFLDAVRVVE